MMNIAPNLDAGAKALLAERLPMDEVPVIDIAPMQTGAGKPAMARDIHEALANIGFMYVKNHGVSAELIREAYAVSKAFFDLPKNEKEALHIKDSGVALHGYTPFFEENNDPTRTIDYKEVFDLGRMAKDGQTRPFFGPTPWPEALPQLQVTMERYHQEMLALAHRLMAALALSLDLAEDYFVSMMQEPVGIQRLLHYPAQDSVSDDRVIGIGAHTDYGCLTILSQDNVGGLQVLHRDGHWIDAPPIEGTFIVNIGDMLQRLTNDTYVANLHRVINTSGKERYSIPCFFDVDFDTEFAPLDKFVPKGELPKYEPIICGQHKWDRYVKAYPHLQSSSGSGADSL